MALESAQGLHQSVILIIRIITWDALGGRSLGTHQDILFDVIKLSLSDLVDSCLTRILLLTVRKNEQIELDTLLILAVPL